MSKVPTNRGGERHASSSEKNAEVVRRRYTAFNASDIETLTEIFDENAMWHTPGRSPIAGDNQGREEVFTQFVRYVGETNGTFKVSLQDVLQGENGRVVAVHHNSGERNGHRLDVGCCIEFEVKDGRIVSGREHFYDLYAWDQFWS